MLRIKPGHKINPDLMNKLQAQGAIKITAVPRKVGDAYEIVVLAENADGTETEDEDCPRPCPDVDDDGDDQGGGG